MGGLVTENYLLVGEVKLADVADDRGIAPRVLGVDSLFAIAEDHNVECLVKPDRLAVAMKEVFAALCPRFEGISVQHNLV